MGRFARAKAILDAAERWKHTCLVNGGSLFGDERLWTITNFNQLQTNFVERPDEGRRGFRDKLQDQLQPTSPEAKRLWAEMTWLYYLIVSPSGASKVTKLDNIRTVWEWSEASLPEGHWALGQVLGEGVVNPGRGYSGH